MKVFLSWSGELSHKAACAFRDWLPAVLQFVEPYVSSEDIDKGARWSTDIAKELEESAYGILFITESNLNAPWITFEAGALSKALEKSRVSPLLINIKRSKIQGPILQFQSTIVDRDDVSKLVFGINANAEDSEQLDETRLSRVFEVWWPQLKEKLDELEGVADPKPDGKKSESTSSAVLEEILDLVRSQQKILTNPEALLPPDYIEYAIDRSSSPNRRRVAEDDSAFEYLSDKFNMLRNLLESVLSKSRPALNKTEQEQVESHLQELKDVIRYLSRNRITRRRRSAASAHLLE